MTKITFEIFTAEILLLEGLIYIIIISYYYIIGRKLPIGKPPEIKKSVRIALLISYEILETVLCFVAPVLIIFGLYQPFMDWTTFNIFFPSYDPFWFQLIGMIIYSFGLFCIISARLALKELHTFPWEPSKLGDGFVQTGFYARVRHPMYTAVILVFIGYIIWFQSWLAMICLIPFILISKFAYDEEKHLLERFGKEYKDYMKKTGRFFPKIRRKK